MTSLRKNCVKNFDKTVDVLHFMEASSGQTNKNEKKHDNLTCENLFQLNFIAAWVYFIYKINKQDYKIWCFTKGDIDIVSNFRLISISPVIAKLIDKILFQQLVVLRRIKSITLILPISFHSRKIYHFSHS